MKLRVVRMFDCRTIIDRRVDFYHDPRIMVAWFSRLNHLKLAEYLRLKLIISCHAGVVQSKSVS